MRLCLFLLAALPMVGHALEPKLIYEEDPTLLTSTIQVVVLSGSSDDPDGKGGLANILSDLMLRGTKKRNRSKFQQEIERMGAQLSGRAFHDRISFVGTVIKENTVPFLELLEDFLLHPALSKDEFEALKKEAIAEINHSKNSNGRLVGLALRRELFSGTRLSLPVEGTLSTVQSIQASDIQRAYNDHFHRGSVVFGVASPLREAEIKKIMTRIWSGLPDGARRSRLSVPLQVPKIPTLVLVHKPETATGSVLLGQAGIVAQEPRRYALFVGNFAFGGEPLISRLFRVIRSDLGWTYAVNSTYHATGVLTYQQGFFVVSTTPSVEFTVKTILKSRQMWDEYLRSGLKNDELKLAQESLINSYPFEFDSSEKRLWQRLYSYLYEVPLLSPEEYAKTISSVSNATLKKALSARHTSDGWLIALVADKAVIEKQLQEEQKDTAPEKQLKITKIYQPEELVR